MDEDLQKLHIEAGRLCGKDKTCGDKINYITEATAIQAAERMNKKPNTRNILEGYPCAFCNGWHIGRKMTRSELESYINDR
jgi:hypothetical protein